MAKKKKISSTNPHVEEWKRLRRKRRARLALILICLLALFAFVAVNLKIKKVTMEGNVHYSKEEMAALLMPDKWDDNPFVFLAKERLGKGPTIPFVDRYTVTLTGLDSVDVIVYEKDIIGYTEVKGKNMYFDRDGIIVETSADLIDGVPKITGIDVAEVSIGETLPVEDTSVFDEILNVSQFLKDTKIIWNGSEESLVGMVQAVKIRKDGSVQVDFGDLKVYLGDSANMEEKLMTMKDIMPQLAGRSGTLYLDSYDPNAANPAYVFK